MVVAALECAALCGAAPRLEAEITAASELLGHLVTEWGPQASENSLAKELARALRGTVPIVYGAELTAPAAKRWKTQINENAKLPAFYTLLPEANHNELSGWENARDLAPLFALFLADRETGPRVLQRVDLTAEFVKPSAAGIQVVESIGERSLERLLSLVLLGDLTSIYLAALNRTDPGPVEAIERFKRELR
jgi:glucose/mannose-6-phosphate isomerase